MSGWGAVAGACAAAGVLLVMSGVLARRPLRPVDRIAPYVSTMAGQEAGLLEGSTLGRILAPSVTQVGQSVRSWLAGNAALEQRLVAAGRRPEEVGAFRISQLTWAFAGMLVAVVGLAVLATTGRMHAGPAPVILLLLAAGTGVLLRDRALTREVAQRRESIRASLPSVADLLALAVGSGESPMAALDRVARVARGPLAAECRRACDDTVAGVAFTEALDAMARRVEVPSVRRFVDGVAIAVQRGTPLADVLRAQAGDARADLHRVLLETAGRKELQMLVPVVFLVLPTVVLVALFPALSSLSALTP